MHFGQVAMVAISVTYFEALNIQGYEKFVFVDRNHPLSRRKQYDIGPLDQ